MKKKVDDCKMVYDLAKPYIENFRTAVDVGSRNGGFTRLMVKHFKNIECFEARKLKHISNAFWTGIGGRKEMKHKVSLHNCALGDVNETVRMYGPIIHDDDWWKNSKIGRNSRQRKYKCSSVEQKLLDSFNFKNVDFIKIDVEGHELKVLKGAVKTIRSFRPVIALEQHDKMEEWCKGEKFDGLNFLKTLGYKQVAFRGMDYIMKYSE
tara:strand:- start:332 stop:955 length:624 start_codon:yes stop_codon:yes gene_type:complete